MAPLRASDGSEGKVTFAELMNLKQTGDDTFQSTTKAFKPGSGLWKKDSKPGESSKDEPTRTYGGHIYAQSVWAAAHTVPQGFVVHSVTGYFTQLGSPEHPFVYNVRRIRTGKSYSARAVDASQPTYQNPDPVFSCICSFKQPDSPDPFHFQASDTSAHGFSLHTHYAAVLSDRSFSSHPDHPSIESPQFYADPNASAKTTPFPGLETKKVDMTAYNTSARPPLARRQLSLYRAFAADTSWPDARRSPNLHACAHLYASDRNSLFVVTSHLGLSERYSLMASLSHTVVFHVTDGAVLSMSESSEQGEPSERDSQLNPASRPAEEKEPPHFIQEAWTDRAGDGRGLHHSRIWDGSGRWHVATTLQDGLVRLKFRDDEEAGRVRGAVESGSAVKL